MLDEAILGKKPSVVHFGFTHCPVICPTTLFEVSERMRELGPLADDIQFIFVTVDPERDTPEELGRYLASFDDRIIGLSGSASDIRALADALGASVTRQSLENGSYTYDHTIFAFLMARGWAKTGVLYMGGDARKERVLAQLQAFALQPERARAEATKQ